MSWLNEPGDTLGSAVQTANTTYEEATPVVMEPVPPESTSGVFRRSLQLYIVVSIFTIVGMSALTVSKLNAAPESASAASCIGVCLAQCAEGSSAEECEYACRLTCDSEFQESGLAELNAVNPNATKPIQPGDVNFSERAAGARFMNFMIDDLDCEQLLSTEEAAEILGVGGMQVNELTPPSVEVVNYVQNDEDRSILASPRMWCSYATTNTNDPLQIQIIAYPHLDITDANELSDVGIGYLAQTYIDELETYIRDQELIVGRNLATDDEGENYCTGVFTDKFGVLKYFVVYIYGDNPESCQDSHLGNFLVLRNKLSLNLSPILTDTAAWETFNNQ